jgi:hypothetical protein
VCGVCVRSRTIFSIGGSGGSVLRVLIVPSTRRCAATFSFFVSGCGSVPCQCGSLLKGPNENSERGQCRRCESVETSALSKYGYLSLSWGQYRPEPCDCNHSCNQPIRLPPSIKTPLNRTDHERAVIHCSGVRTYRENLPWQPRVATRRRTLGSAPRNEEAMSPRQGAAARKPWRRVRVSAPPISCARSAA